MKITTILAALLALAIATPAAFAKKPKGEKSAGSGVFAKYDKNGNGVLDADEKATIEKSFGTDPDLAKYDTNGDKKLDDNEIAAIKPDTAGKKKKKKKA
jgi:hypothetical protein